ncbi:hypothetical protein F2Q70_00003325 [Brassica cretica]|uniref:Uncharacterized protein n=1 Tax=Brassica cretica TaxID=69181 RepID=A0A8S9IJT3_BRACR|nr:hypothetical protein F2Q70_00003325 [Brassica cretica]
MWFPIPEAIVRALDRFELSICQLNVAALQNFLGVLILSYELGMDLSPDDFEGLWGILQMPRDGSSIFSMFELMAHPSRRTFSPCYVANGTFIVWCSTDHEASSDLYMHQIWTSHTPTLFPIRGRELGPERTRESLSKTENLSHKIFRYPDGTRVSPRVMGVEPARLPIRMTSLPTFLPVLLLQRHWMKHRGEKWSRKGMLVFNSTLDGSFREERLSHFKAEEIERKFIRFQNEVAERECIQAESHSRALIRAERKGRRAIAAELAKRVTLFDAEFRSFKDTQDYVGDFRECRGAVGTLLNSQNADFSFLFEVAEMSGLMDGCAQAESMVPPIEGRIRELWEPIEVSEDTTEAVFVFQKMTSRKRSSKKNTSPQSSSGNPCTNEEIVPKEEFEVEQEEMEAYWDALCGSITPQPEVFYPAIPQDPRRSLILPFRAGPLPPILRPFRSFTESRAGLFFKSRCMGIVRRIPLKDSSHATMLS